MKTLIEYEPSDITTGEGMDPIHAFLMGQFLVVGLGGFKPREDDPKDDPVFPIRRMIAEFLNSAQRSGIAITKSELPDAFKGSLERPS